MSESSAPFWPGSRELEALINHAVAQRVDPLTAQLASVGRALAILAERMPEPGQAGEVTSRVDALAARLEELAPVSGSLDGLQRAVREDRADAEHFRRTATAALEQAVATIEGALTTDSTRILDRLTALEAPLTRVAEGGNQQADELGTAITVHIDRVLAQVEADRAAGATALERTLDRIEADRAAGAAALERSLDRIEVARATEAAQVLERLTALEGPLAGDAAARQAHLDEVRDLIVSRIDKAVSRIDEGRMADADRIVDRIAALAVQSEADARRSHEQATALLATIDQRLESLHAAATDAGGASEGRLGARLEAITATSREVLLARIDDRTAALTDIEAMAPRLAAEVRDATASALTSIESVTPRLAAEVHEATGTALTSKVDPLVAKLVDAIDMLAHEAGRIEALARGHAGESRAVEERIAAVLVEVAERAEAAVDRSRGRIAEGQVALGAKLESTVAELLTAVGAATDRLETRLAESGESLRASGGHQNAALLDAVNHGSQQLSEGLAEVRSSLVATVTDAAARATEAERRADALVEGLDALRGAIQVTGHDPRLEALLVEQVAAREAQTAAIDAVTAQIKEVGPVVARALLPEVERAIRAANATEETLAGLHPDALRAAVVDSAGKAASEVEAATRRLERTIAAVAEQVDQGLTGSGTVLEDLRASQVALREAVQDGSHKAELAALDIRGLRDRLTPHLVALADATTRRAEADQAGFDAVLARLDQLLATRQP